MNHIQKRLGSLFIAIIMLLSIAVTPAMASEQKAPPTKFSVSTNFGSDFVLDFNNTTSWSEKINGITVNDNTWEKVSYSFSVNKNTSYYVSSSAVVYIGEGFSGNEATCIIHADGYKDLTLNLDKGKHTAAVAENTAEATYTVTVAQAVNGTVAADKVSGLKEGETVIITANPAEGYEVDTLTVIGNNGAVEVQNNRFTMPAENVTVSCTFKEKQAVPSVPPSGKTIELSNVKLESDLFKNDWYLTFGTENDSYIQAITGVSVNDTPWQESSTKPSDGGKYCKYTNYENRTYLAFAQKSYGSTPVLKSGDAITITANGYDALSFKLVITNDGKAVLQENDGNGDPYKLHVKLVGSFEAAIVGQKDYDGVSGASTGGVSGNKNSAVTVYGALVEKDAQPTDSDFEELNHLSKIRLNGNKCSVSIVPDTSNGTSASAESGMKGVYLTLSSGLTLNGTPKDAGNYLISVSVEDSQGRAAVSNSLPFRIYTGEETLADQLQIKNLKQYSNGLYAWDIMEPWAIKNFGSNVDGKDNSVRVPEKLEVLFGSHTSGTYGILGYDIAWKEVKAGEIPQTLYIPDGCHLTLANMKILSSVRIVVEKGGKLTLSDSAVQGIIDVQNGGTFSMNYDSFNRKFTTGSSICGQLRMESGSVLENAAIYSHTNYLANGKLTDRSNDDAVVITRGNVTVKGQVFIQGDEAGSTMKGQTALEVDNGILTLADNAVLATYGGGGKVTLYSDGGNAVVLNNGTIKGSGKLIAIGGPVMFGSGNSAVSGSGTIDVPEVFIQGAVAYEHKKDAKPGKAHDNTVTIKSSKQHVEDGKLLEGSANDPIADLYWKISIDAAPDLSKYNNLIEKEAVPATTPVTGGTSSSGSSLRKAPLSSGSSVSAITTKNGSVTVDYKNAKKGDTITVTVSPDKGYKPGNIVVKDANGNKLALTDKGNGKYTFIMPDSKVTVSADFTEIKAAAAFADVPTDAYYAEAVKWAQEKGITTGNADGLFGSDNPCTRGQIVAFLWRAAGSPEPNSLGSLTDISSNDYYAKAVAWAIEKGITSGVGNGKFNPNANCTRAQAATFLYRTAGSPSVSGNAAFSDVSADAYYASAIKWAEQNGITGGIGGGLFGSGNECTRAQIIAFLHRTYKVN